MSRSLAAGIALALSAVSVQSQTTVPPYRLSVQADTVTGRKTRDLGTISTPGARSPLDEARAALRELVVAEEEYFALRHAYTKDRTALRIVAPAGGQPEAEVIFAGKTSWSGRVKLSTPKPKSCVLFVGNAKDLPNGPPKTAGAGIVATTAGVPACDAP
jgi:hypothetical protein